MADYPTIEHLMHAKHEKANWETNRLPATYGSLPSEGLQNTMDGPGRMRTSRRFGDTAKTGVNGIPYSSCPEDFEPNYN